MTATTATAATPPTPAEQPTPPRYLLPADIARAHAALARKWTPAALVLLTAAALEAVAVWAVFLR